MKMLLKSCFSVVSLDFHRFTGMYWREAPEMAGFCLVLAIYICTYLAAECRNRSENLTNRKLSIFCIETIYQLFSNSNHKIFFFGIKKKSEKKNSKNYFSVKIPENLKFRVSDKIFRISDFFRDFHRKIFLADFFFKKYFWSRKNIFFFGVGKKIGT